MVKPGKPDIPTTEDVPSKSQLKRDAREMLLLGRRLAALPPSALDELHLDTRLHEQPGKFVGSRLVVLCGHDVSAHILAAAFVDRTNLVVVEFGQ